MKLTAFDPCILTAHPQELVRLFEALGFEKRHTKGGIKIADEENTVIRMSNPDGFHVDVVQSQDGTARDVTGIRVNVDDFQEAYRFFQERGFRNIHGDQTVETSSSKSAILAAPSGFTVSLIHHKKD